MYLYTKETEKGQGQLDRRMEGIKKQLKEHEEQLHPSELFSVKQLAGWWWLRGQQSSSPAFPEVWRPIPGGIHIPSARLALTFTWPNFQWRTILLFKNKLRWGSNYNKTLSPPETYISVGIKSVINLIKRMTVIGWWELCPRCHTVQDPSLILAFSNINKHLCHMPPTPEERFRASA